MEKKRAAIYACISEQISDREAHCKEKGMTIVETTSTVQSPYPHQPPSALADARPRGLGLGPVGPTPVYFPLCFNAGRDGFPPQMSPLLVRQVFLGFRESLWRVASGPPLRGLTAARRLSLERSLLLS